ncbi:hypothetical protein FSP39_012104 [Pinctada imbricata]|uniref:Uncharacterized protein n=1 Tax=Pinctada imbricata TaxID=66713 RepID=A0AA89C1H1_PINIB|nr:hypothetical protein FSP39_012104 [Pinctada imbricata]
MAVYLLSSFLTLTLCLVSVKAAYPQGCTYDSTELLFTCNARSWSLPMTYTDFSSNGEVPQRILLREVDGELPNGVPTGPTFSGFSSIATGSFDPNYSPSLHIRCVSNGQLIITQGTFADMGYVTEFKIEDCDILSLPANVFTNLGNLNSFTIEGGSIDAMVGDSFTGMTVQKMTSESNPLGLFAIRNSRLQSGGFSFGALYSQASVSQLIVENANLNVLQTDMFYALKQLTYLSISYNSLTYLPEDLFKGINSLTRVDMYGISWACTCTNKWFISWLASNNITLNGDIVCGSPTSYENVKMALFDKEQCEQDTPCTGKSGVVVGNYCLLIFDIINYALLFITFVLSLIALGLIIHTKRQVGGAKDAKQGGAGNGKNKMPPGMRKNSSSSSFNKVEDMKSISSATRRSMS